MESNIFSCNKKIIDYVTTLSDYLNNTLTQLCGNDCSFIITLHKRPDIDLFWLGKGNLNEELEDKGQIVFGDAIDLSDCDLQYIIKSEGTKSKLINSLFKHATESLDAFDKLSFLFLLTFNGSRFWYGKGILRDIFATNQKISKSLVNESISIVKIEAEEQIKHEVSFENMSFDQLNDSNVRTSECLQIDLQGIDFQTISSITDPIVDELIEKLYSKSEISAIGFKKTLLEYHPDMDNLVEIFIGVLWSLKLKDPDMEMKKMYNVARVMLNILFPNYINSVIFVKHILKLNIFKENLLKMLTEIRYSQYSIFHLLEYLFDPKISIKTVMQYFIRFKVEEIKGLIAFLRKIKYNMEFAASKLTKLRKMACESLICDYRTPRHQDWSALVETFANVIQDQFTVLSLDMSPDEKLTLSERMAFKRTVHYLVPFSSDPVDVTFGLRNLSKRKKMPISRIFHIRVTGPPLDWDTIPPSDDCKVRVSGIPNWWHEDQLIPYFEKVGKIYTFELAFISRRAEWIGRHRGWGTITYCSQSSAKCAVKKFNNIVIGNKPKPLTAVLFNSMERAVTKNADDMDWSIDNGLEILRCSVKHGCLKNTLRLEKIVCDPDETDITINYYPKLNFIMTSQIVIDKMMQLGLIGRNEAPIAKRFKKS